MLTLENLSNIQAFLQRAPMTGREAIGWVQTMAAVEAEIKAASTPPAPPAA